MRHRRCLFVVFVAGLTVAIAGASAAGAFAEGRPSFGFGASGNLVGVAVDERGGPIPGVTVTLNGSGVPKVQRTNVRGQFRFLNLPAGTYTASAQRPGLLTIRNRSVAIATGRSTTIAMTMSALPTSPSVLDTTNTTVGTVLSQDELRSFPTARDPWSILQQVPGVLADRVNIGGSQTGERYTFVGPGSVDQSVWTVDGVVITDMAALGSSPSYYDFDAFEEMHITTGGADASIATGGVVLNLVTKRGTNDRLGSAWFYGAPSASHFSDPQFIQIGGNALKSQYDFGADLGGPAIKDKAWFWSSYGHQTVHRDTIAGGQATPRDFRLNAFTGNFTYKLNSNNQLNGLFGVNPYNRAGEGASPTVSPDATWRQSGTPFNFKVSDTFTLTKDLSFTGSYARIGQGFQLNPLGDLAVPTELNGILQGSNFQRDARRSSQQMWFDGVSDCSNKKWPQKLTLGAGYRTFHADSSILFPANRVVFPGSNLQVFPLGLNTSITNKYGWVYAQDSLAIGNLTANLGIRYDYQVGRNNPSVVLANPLQPIRAPGITYDGGEAGFSWKTFSPRLGLTYALGAERKTLLRASYSRFADQLGTGTAAFLNPLASNSYFYAFYGSAIQESNGSFINFGPKATDPNFLLTRNLVDPKLSPPITSELTVGLDHALLPEFVVGLNLTYRKISGILDTTDLIRDASGQVRPVKFTDWMRTGNATGVDLNGTPFTLPTFGLNNNLNFTGGRLLSNGMRQQSYTGVNLVFNKRLANRWMMRGNFTFNDWKWDVPDASLVQPFPLLNSGFENGAPVATPSLAENKSSVFIGSHYQYSLYGLYQFGAGVNVSGSVYGRQGYVLPLFLPLLPGNVQVGKLDQLRLDSLHIVDLGVSKDLKLFPQDIGLTLSADVFNLLNSQSALQKINNLADPRRGTVTEVLSPRVFRFGARLSFR